MKSMLPTSLEDVRRVLEMGKAEAGNETARDGGYAANDRGFGGDRFWPVQNQEARIVSILQRWATQTGRPADSEIADDGFVLGGEGNDLRDRRGIDDGTGEDLWRKPSVS